METMAANAPKVGSHSPLISVIIPVYNVELYLERCVNSILQQTYQNMEIILVDDGSTDRSGSICDQYQGKDHRIIVIHQTNGGLSAARNAGLKSASGELLTFIDSDDWVVETYLETLYRLLVENGADIAIGSYIKTDSQDIQLVDTRDQILVFSAYEALAQIYGRFYVTMILAWGKLYRRSLFDGIEFPVGKIHEDQFITYRVLHKARKVVLTTEILIFYWQRPGSIMSARDNLIQKNDLIEAHQEQIAFYTQQGYPRLAGKALHRLFEIYRGILAAGVFENEAQHQKYLNEMLALSSPLWKVKQSLAQRLLYWLYFAVKGYRHDPYYLPWVGFSVKIRRLVGKIKSILRIRGFVKIYSHKVATMVINRLKDAFLSFKKYRPVQRAMKRIQGKRLILIGTPEHGNLGDHAIAEGALKLLQDFLPQIPVIEITGNHFRKQRSRIVRAVRPGDVILVQGGGFLGSLWRFEDSFAMEVIRQFRTNPIIFLPQTMYYGDSPTAKIHQEAAHFLFNHHPDLTIFARDENTVQILQKMLDRTGAFSIDFSPDLALYLMGNTGELERSGILFCIRRDRESVIAEEVWDTVIAAVDTSDEIRLTDTLAGKELFVEERQAAIQQKLQEFQSARVVITDRLHGMIFAVITGTPCIALNNVSGKVKGTHFWLQSLPSVAFVESVEEILSALEKQKNISPSPYDKNTLLPHYQKIVDCITEKLALTE
ncbi:MAG: glycosyltransferase [Anaerolineae bacterium]|jgi:exopolysaccharide biosynthesis predicted pyruvyltransferase EpsI|nr:glycosyltransferase [Anaerolineae bacterium]